MTETTGEYLYSDLQPRVFRTKEAADQFFGRQLSWVYEPRKRSGSCLSHHDGRWLALEGGLKVCVAHVYDNHDDFVRNASVKDIMRD